MAGSVGERGVGAWYADRMPETFYVRFEDGTQYGPAPLDLITQWARQGRLRRPCSLVSSDNSSPPIPAASHPLIGPILRAPPTTAAPLPAPEAGFALIPARNPPALSGYYVSVFSLIPGFALLLGPLAVTLGIIGWRKYRREPHVKGAAHAWIAIILGGLTTLVNWGIAIAAAVALALSK